MNYKFLFAVFLTITASTTQTIPTAHDILFTEGEDLEFLLDTATKPYLKAMITDTQFDPKTAPTIWARHPLFNAFALTAGPRSAYPTRYELLCPELLSRLLYLQNHQKDIPSLEEINTLASNCIAHAEELKKKLGEKIFYNRVDLDDVVCPASAPSGLSLSQLKPVFGALCFTKILLAFFVQLAMSAVEHPETPSHQETAKIILKKYEKYLIYYMRDASEKNEEKCNIYLAETIAFAQATIRTLR